MVNKKGNIGIKITTFTEPYPVIHEGISDKEAIAHVTPNGSNLGVIFFRDGGIRIYVRSSYWAEGYTPDLHRESYAIDGSGGLVRVAPVINK